LAYLFAAFIVIWLGLFGYVLYWQRQLRDIQAEVRALRSIAERDQPPA